MIQYDNKAPILKLLMRISATSGSVIPKALLPGFISFVIALLLEYACDMGAPCGEDPKFVEIKHPLGIQMYAYLLGFVLVFRTSMALNRYTEGLSCMQTMASKWTDAGLNVVAFIDTGIMNAKTEDMRHTILHRRRQVLHWLSLMHAMAVQLVNGYDKPNFDDMHGVDFHMLKKMKSSGYGGRASMTIDQGRRHSNQGDDAAHLAAALAATAGGSKRSANPPGWNPDFGPADPVKSLVSEEKLRVLGHITEDEKSMLKFANDPVEVVSYWTCWSFTQMRQDNWFSVHPAICSRVYQELSKGTLGYWQASKLIYVPFPFPFAQMVTLQLCFLVFLFPIMVTSVTTDLGAVKYISPLFSLFGVSAYWGLNIVAIEIEMPFGDDPNDLALVAHHEMFVTALSSLYLAQAKYTQMDMDHFESQRALNATKIIAELNAMLARLGADWRFEQRATRADLRVVTQSNLADKVGFDIAVIIYERLQKLLAVPNT